MDFRQLEVFVSVVDKQSFSKAAESLYLSQPTVSAHISALEKELGKSLISRSTKSFQLTEAGSRLYSHAQSILSMKRRLYDVFDEVEHTIHIGASTIPCMYVLPDLLSQYRLLNSKVRFNIHHTDSQSIINQLVDGSLDVGFVGKRALHEQLVCEAVGEDSLVIVTPATAYYRRLIDQGVSVAQILSEPYIAREEGSGTAAQTQQLLELYALDMTRLNVVATVNNQSAIVNMVSSGLGISIVSSFVADQVAMEKRVYVIPFPDNFTRQLYLVYKKKGYYSNEAKKFVEYMKAK